MTKAKQRTMPAALRQRVVDSLDHYGSGDVPRETLEAAIAAAAIVFAVWPDEHGIGASVLTIKGGRLAMGKAIKGARLVAFPVCCHRCALEAQKLYGHSDTD